jgi:hypothetical protein
MKILILNGLLTALSMIPAYAQLITEKSGATSVLGIRTRWFKASLPSSTAENFLDLAGAVRMQRAGNTKR